MDTDMKTGIQPLPDYDGRKEELVFANGSRSVVVEAERRSNRDLYVRMCRAAVSRVFTTEDTESTERSMGNEGD